MSGYNYVLFQRDTFYTEPVVMGTWADNVTGHLSAVTAVTEFAESNGYSIKELRNAKGVVYVMSDGFVNHEYFDIRLMFVWDDREPQLT